MLCEAWLIIRECHLPQKGNFTIPNSSMRPLHKPKNSCGDTNLLLPLSLVTEARFLTLETSPSRIGSYW